MRKLTPLLFLLFIGAKKKKDEPAPVPVPEVAPAAAPAPEPPPEPAPPPAPVIPKNANLTVSLTRQDGTSKAGKVTGIERSGDFYGDAEWVTDDSKLTLTVEVGTTEKSVKWTDVKSVTVVAGKLGENVDCTYSSDFSPWMYECTLRNDVSVVLKDGTKGKITSRHMWNFYFEDGEKIQFTLYKYFVREQDDRDVQLGDDAENMALYTKLQDRIRTDMKGSMIKAITLQ